MVFCYFSISPRTLQPWVHSTPCFTIYTLSHWPIMSHQWSTEDFCNELEHVSKLLEARPGSQVGKAALETLKQRLHGVTSWTPSALSDLYEKVTEANLPESLKDDVMNEMDALSASGQSGLQLSQRPQSLHNLPPYLTSNDWLALEQGSNVDGQRVICERLKSLGMRSMKEDTKRSAMGVLLHVLVNLQHQPMPSPWAIYWMVQDLTKTFGHCANNDLPGLKVYPLSPSQLTAAFKEKAYGIEQPALMNVSLAAIYPKIPLRSTSNLLTGIPKPQTSAPAPQAALADGGFQEKMEKFIDQYNEDKEKAELKQKAGGSGGTRLALQDVPSPASAAQPLALPNAPPLPCAPHQVNDKPGLEDFEQMAHDALSSKKTRKVMKRPAASSASCSNGQEKKKTVKKDNASTSKVFGCCRCRGNPKGCEKCRSPGFKGQRFNGRHEWNDMAAKKGWK